MSDIAIISDVYKIINHSFSFLNDFRLPCFSIKFMPLFFMKEKSIQHVVSYSNNEFCIEGTWITGCMNPSKSLYDKNEDVIRSPPIFFHANIFYLSFYFDTHHDLFKIFIDMENDLTRNFPVTVNLIMKNHKPLNALRFQSQFYFTPQAKHGVATFDKKTCLEVFSDEGFSFDGFFIFQYSFKHKKNSTQSPLKYNFYSQNMSLIDHATKYLYKTDNLYGFTNNCKYAGISNQGATCYLNSVLQALFHIPAFRSLVYQIPMTDSDKTKKTMIYNLQKLFAQMENSNKAVSTRDLTISFGWTSAESFKQNDAQELLRVFLESLEKKLKNKIKDQNSSEKNSTNKPNNNISIQIDNNNDNNSNNQTDNSNTNNDSNNTNDIDEEKNKINLDISDLFKFQVTQTIECPKVSFRNTRDDDYLDLAVEVRGCQDLHQSLKKFTLPEKLDSPYSTDEYGPQQAIMYNRFKTLPKVLFIHLKRFEYRPPNLTERFVNKINSSYQLGNNLTKINDRFEFPINIDLAEFVEQSNKEKNWVYELFGVLVHSGSASFGHYYAYLRPENSNQWFKFNDSTVSQCNEQDAVNNNYGDGSNCASGYMLIYMRKEDLPQLFTETVKPPKDILKEPEPTPVPVPEKPKSVENIINNKTDQKSIENYSQIDNIFYHFDGFGSNLLQVKIITDENLRDGCDECSLAISSLDRNKDGYCKGKSANYLFQDSGIILIRRGATESELFDRVSSFFNQNENDDDKEENANENSEDPIESLDNKIQFYSNKKVPNENSEASIESLNNKLQFYSDRNSTETSTKRVLKDKNDVKFDLYMMNLTNSEGTMTRKLHPTNEQFSTFGPNSISIFYRSKEQKIKSSTLNINNYCTDETEEEEDHENEAIKTTTKDDDEYYPILGIDNGFERTIKHVLNASHFITSSIKGVFNGATNIISKNIDSIKSIHSEKAKNKKKTKNGDKILLFLKVFDYKKQEIRFLKTRNVYHDDKLSVLFEDAIQFFYPEKQAQSDNIKNIDAIKFYSKKFSTIFEDALPDKTFKENKIYNGCIIIMQDSNESITISPNKLKCSYPIVPSHQNEEKIKNLKTLIEYPPMSNSLIDYIDAKYNMCEAIVSSYDNPSDFLFILRYSFNNEVSTLKSIIAKKAGIDAYDPQTNSIVLYTQHLNSEDEPNSSPLTYHSRMTSPLNRLFYRFFADTPEAKIGQMVVVKVWMEDKEMKTVLAPKSGTVNDVVQKIIETESLNLMPTDFDISLDKSGAVLCQIPSNFKIFSVTSNCSIHLSRKSEKNDDCKVAKIAVCHTKGIKLFVPFFFEIFEKEEFIETKKRLKIEVKSHQIGKIDAFGVDSYDSYFDSLLISVHRLNKSMYDTMKPIKIADSDKLFDTVKEDNTSFLFVELPKEKVGREGEKSIKKNTNVITID